MFLKTAFRDHKIERNNFTDSISVDLFSIFEKHLKATQA